MEGHDMWFRSGLFKVEINQNSHVPTKQNNGLVAFIGLYSLTHSLSLSLTQIIRIEHTDIKRNSILNFLKNYRSYNRVPVSKKHAN